MKQSILFYIILIWISLLSRSFLLLTNTNNGNKGDEHSELIEEIDELTNNEDESEDSTVSIDEEDQDRLLKEAGLNCSSMMSMSQLSNNLLIFFLLFNL